MADHLPGRDGLADLGPSSITHPSRNVFTMLEGPKGIKVQGISRFISSGTTVCDQLWILVMHMWICGSRKQPARLVPAVPIGFDMIGRLGVVLAGRRSGFGRSDFRSVSDYNGIPNYYLLLVLHMPR
jgi:hypothetical protein